MNKDNQFKEISFLQIVKRSLKIGKKILAFDFTIMFITSLFFSVFPVVGVYLNKKIYSTVEILVNNKNKLHYFINILLLYGAYLFIMKSDVILFKRYYFQYNSLLKFEKKVKNILHKKCAEIPLENYENAEIYNYARRAQNASINIYRIVEIIIYIFCYLVGTLCIGFYISKIKSIFIIFVILAAIPTLAEKIFETIQKDLYIKETTQSFREEEAYRECLVSYEFLKETRVMGSIGYIFEKWKDIFYKLLNTEWKMYKKISTFKVITNTFKFIGDFGGFFLAAFLFIKDQINFGEFTACLIAFNYLSNYFNEFFDLIGSFSQFAVLVKPFFRFMDIENKSIQKNTLNFSSNIVLKDVCFNYPGFEENVINNISLKINKGEKIAIVGKNGSGKSTLVNLILGLYTPSKGHVLYDNEDISLVSEDALFKNNSAVFQRFNHYSNLNIEENVMISDPYKVKKETELVSVFKNAGLDFNHNKMLIGKEFGGTELSGGQWQKIAIARGFYRESNIIVLDEPTSAIDPIKEIEIYQSFIKMIKDKTAILVTHRLGAVKMVNKILVLDNGQIVEQGTHNQLLKSKGYYYRLWKSQIQWYE